MARRLLDRIANTRKVNCVAKFRGFLAVAGFLALRNVSALAVPVIDQSNLAILTSLTDPGTSDVSIVRSQQRWQAQTVTVGISGTLSRLDLQIDSDSGAGSLQISVLRGSIVDPASEVLGTFLVPDSDLPTPMTITSVQYFSIDLNDPTLMFEAGDVFTILLNAIPEVPGRIKRFGWVYSSDVSDPTTGLDYPRGINYLRIPGIPPQQTIYDRGFRTWVEPAITSAPEPVPIAVLSFGIIGVGLARRRIRP